MLNAWRITVTINGSVLVLLAVALVACGGGSGGTAQISVPNVVGDQQAAATAAITGAGLTVGAVTQQSSGTVASGDVISENPAANATAEKGSAVALVISTGPPTYSVGGTVIGLRANATVHVLNGADNVPVSANGSFTLPTAVASGNAYSVSVGTPTSAQTCAVQNASGTIASANVKNVLVYCTYTVTDATLNNTYTSALAAFAQAQNGISVAVDDAGVVTFNGMGTYNATVAVNNGGTIISSVPALGTYAVTTTNAIPNLNVGGSSAGGIEGVNGAATVGFASTASGTEPSFGVSVLPDTNATTDSVNGKYTQASIVAKLSTGEIKASEGNVTLASGTVTGTLTSNTAGTVTSGTSGAGQFTISNGTITVVGQGTGAVSQDDDLIVVADTNSGDNPSIAVLVRQGTGVTTASFEGVYAVVVYGGNSITAPVGQVLTVFAYGDGTYTATYTQNDNGTVTTNNAATGTYTVAADGTLTLTGSSGGVSNGAISADGNALVLANITSGQKPTMYVGVRQ